MSSAPVPSIAAAFVNAAGARFAQGLQAELAADRAAAQTTEALDVLERFAKFERAVALRGKRDMR